MRPTHSATLAIDEAVNRRRAAGQTVLHLGFGEAGLPAPASVVEVLRQAAVRNGYGPVAGSVEAREAAAGWFCRRGLSTEADQIIFGPGSKSLLFAVLAAIEGDVVLPQPAWVSYAAQAGLLGRRVIGVPIPDSAGGIPDPELLEAAVVEARAAGSAPSVLVLTVPDNPTGTVAGREQLRAVCAIAERQGLAIICDEIYAELTHEGSSPSAATFLPQRTIVTTGLSKSLALGGWRVGYARTPGNAWGQDVRRSMVGIASEVWSNLAAPMQAVATHVLSDPMAVTVHIDTSRRLHARIAGQVFREFVAAGVSCRAPQAGFYLYPDFEPVREVLAAQDITSSVGLARQLLDKHGIATLPGAVFGDPADRLTLRIATSLLYGSTPEQQSTTLASPKPEELPWVRMQMDLLRDGLRALVEPASILV